MCRLAIYIRRPPWEEGHLPPRNVRIFRTVAPTCPSLRTGCADSACKELTLGDARDGALSDPNKIFTKSRENWGHASAQQIKRVSVESEGGNLHLSHHVGEELEDCDLRQAVDRAPHVPTDGTSLAFMFNEKLRFGPLFLGCIIALHVMDVSSKFSSPPPARSRNPQEVWGVFPIPRIGIFGPPTYIQMDEGGERKNEMWTDSCSECPIKPLHQGVGAHPRILGGRNGLARGIYNCLFADDRYTSRQIPSEVQWRAKTMISASVYSAFPLHCRPDPADLFG